MLYTILLIPMINVNTIKIYIIYIKVYILYQNL